jgi:hypothetical protein
MNALARVERGVFVGVYPDAERQERIGIFMSIYIVHIDSSVM